MIDLYPVLRPVLMEMDAERAHQCVLTALKLGFGPAYTSHDKILQVNLLGKTFPNPLGLAAGFDKGAEVMEPCLRMGFGFVEAGTVTPRPQPGNPRPRVFRDAKSQSVINRMGFPGRGLEAYEANVRAFRAKGASGIVGANIGMNKDAPDAGAAYAEGLVRLSPFADYIAVNISSPNTPGLRGLQNKGS